MNTKYNITPLQIWIAENGETQAKDLICKEAGITRTTLSRILNGSTTRFGVRYRIYKLTGIKLSNEDDFPPLSEIAS